MVRPKAGHTHLPPSLLPPPSSSGDATFSIHPTPVSLRKVRTAWFVLSSPNMFLTDGAFGCFHPRASPTSFDSLSF